MRDYRKGEAAKNRRLQIRVNRGTAERAIAAATAQGYESLSEAIREFMDDLIAHHEKQKTKAKK